MSRREWPPRDPLIRCLSDIVDASPRPEWMTSNERVREAERLISELRRHGYVIAVKRREPA